MATSPRVSVRDVPTVDAPIRALADAAIEINAAPTLDALLDAVSRHTRTAVRARVGWVRLLPSADAPDLVAVSLHRVHGGSTATAEPPDMPGLADRVLGSQRPLRLGRHELSALETWRGLLAVALIGAQGRPLGLILASDREQGDFDVADEVAIVPIAQITALAVERHHREQEVSRGRRDLAEAQRIAGVGSWLMDFATGVLSWDEEVYRIFGVPAGSFGGDYAAFMECVHPDDRRLVDDAMTTSLVGGDRYRVEHRIVRPDGRVRSVLERAEVERDEQGRAVRMLGTVLDITEPRRVEDELRARSERISALAADRGRLIAASVEAEERARQQIAEDLHDGVLQDILAARQDLAESEDADPDDARRLLARAAEGLVEATTGLRSAVGALHPMTLTHGGLEAALGAVARAAARRAGFAVTVTLDAGTPGPHDRLVLALGREFVVNAEKHSAATAVELRLDRLYGVTRLSVRDDGVGFDPSGAGGAFQVGHIGLASARERVEVLGGTLTIDSAPGRGTRVTAGVPANAAGGGEPGGVARDG